MNEHTPTPVTKQWTWSLSFKMQTVLLSALRGCDGQSKNDASKKLVRALRSVILNNASPGDDVFMRWSPDFDAVLKEVSEDLDRYPVHWVMHFAHAAEIVGYLHPDRQIRESWFTVYQCMVRALHLQIESHQSLMVRLQDGPISPVYPPFVPVPGSTGDSSGLQKTSVTSEVTGSRDPRSGFFGWGRRSSDHEPKPGFKAEERRQARGYEG